jgi:DNA-directed RNA polymerase delta subunit
MNFIKPIKYESKKIRLTDDTWKILQNYSEYCNRSVDEVVEVFLQNLILDEDFIHFAKTKRNNVKICKILGIELDE